MQQIIDCVTNEVMHILTGGYEVSESGSESIQTMSIEGKTISLLVPNIDVNLDETQILLKDLAKKNIIKAFFPKWGKTVGSKSNFDSNIKINYIDFNKVNNSSLLSADMLILFVNNDNIVRKISKIDKSNAYLSTIANALAQGKTLYLIPDNNFSLSDNQKYNLLKIGAKVCTITELKQSLISRVVRKVNTNKPNVNNTKVLFNNSSNKIRVDSSIDPDDCNTCTSHACISQCLPKVNTVLDAGADRIGATLGNDSIPFNVAKYIDHTLLKPDVKEDQVIKLCEEAKKYKFASVCVNPSHVALSSKLLKGTDVMVCTVIGFPLGATTSETKAFETSQAIRNGADEIDMVINVGALKSKDYALVEKDIRDVVTACNGTTLKVILETSLLNEEDKIKGCEISKRAGATFVKTSTGFGGGGATEVDIALMRRVVGPDMGVKASGAVRDQETAIKMLRAGATRIGASASIAISKGEKSKSSGY